MESAKPLVLHLSTETGWRGGERQVQLLTNGMLARDWPCLVACPPQSPLFADRAAQRIAVSWRATGEFDLTALAQLVRFIRRRNIALLHAHTAHAHSLAWLASGLTGVPVVVTRRVDFPISRHCFSRRKYTSRRITFIAISHGVRDVLVSGGVPPERIHVVHSGIDLSRYAFREGPRDDAEAQRWGVQPGEPLILNVAALVDHKDHMTLVRAAAHLQQMIPSPWKILIAGWGELEAEIRREIQHHKLEHRVLLLGYISDLASLYRAADFFVLSSHLEGLCTSILDAMAAGVPVVATRTGGIPEAVEHGSTGLLVPPRDPAALAQAMAEMLRDPRARQRFAQAAFEKVRKEFAADAMVEGTLAVYEQVLALGQ